MSKDKDSQLIWEKYFQEKNKKPDADGDGVPDWADKHDGEDDHEEVEEGTDGSTGDLTEREKFKFAADAAKKGKGPLVDKEKPQPEPKPKQNDESYGQIVADEEKFLETAHKYYGDMEEGDLKYHHYVLEELLEMDELTRREYQGQGPQRDR
jgi:hypothetical protein